MKLWQKDITPHTAVESFTAGKDREMDLFIAEYDVIGSLAHLEMLRQTGLIPQDEAILLESALKDILQEVKEGHFVLEEGVEDVHSQVELLLTSRVGEAGKKIHTGRSRNDQVLTDMKLFFKAELQQTVAHVKHFFDLLMDKSDAYSTVLMPGYTHFQIGMVSSFGLWFAAYGESLSEDLLSVQSAYQLANKNPLGSAAGYGSSYPLDRDLTTRLLGFESPHINVLAAQMSRGKTERVIAQALANIAATLTKFSYDCCLFMSGNFGFIRFPDHLTTGSSIMPHKKNPDVFELVRARCNSLQALPNEITMMTNNLPSGYHRDFQLIKERIFPAFGMLHDCLDMLCLMVENITITPDLLDDPKYKYLFTVEEINKLTHSGVPFREAYKQVGYAVENGTFEPGAMLTHTHLGSIGNLGNDRIRAAMEEIIGCIK